MSIIRDYNLFNEILNRKLSVVYGKTYNMLEQERLVEINPFAEYSLDLCTDEQIQSVRAKLLQELRDTKYELIYNRSPFLKEAERTVLRNHNKMVERFYDRLEINKSKIESKLLGGNEFNRILKVNGDGADVHNHGQLTLVVTTDVGKFVYKPHSLALDVAFKKLNDELFSDVFYIPSCVDCEEYGYVEYVNNKPVDTKDTAAKYYYNLGGFTAFALAFGSSDMHRENFLANGTLPVPCDLETIISPKFKPIYDQPTFIEDYNNSVSLSGLLPGSGKYEFSPLTSLIDNASAPVVDGIVQTVHPYKESYFRGFDSVYHRIEKNKHRLLQTLCDVGNAPVRSLLRNTNYYAFLLNELSDAKYADSLEGQIDYLSKTSDRFTDPEKNWMANVIEAENDSLLERDIPYFYTLATSTDIYSDGKCISSSHIALSASDNARAHIEKISEIDRIYEKNLIERALEYSLVKLDQAVAVSKPEDTAFLTRDEALNEAIEIFNSVYSSAVISPSSKLGFVGNVADNSSFRVLQFDFATGIIGIFVFAAAISSKCPSLLGKAERIGETYISFLEYYVKSIEDQDVVSAKRLDIGLTDGYAGIIKSVTLIEKYMPNYIPNELLERLYSICSRIRIEDYDDPDIYGGLAGLIIALNSSSIDNKDLYIEKCADRILKLRSMEYNNLHLWETISKKRPIGGYGHGCGGIGMALLYAYDAIGKEEYKKAAEEAYLFEHSTYSEVLKTWPDFRNPDHSKRFMHGICAGAPGEYILNLKGEQEGIANSTIDKKKAYESMRNHPWFNKDTLCCGNSSDAESFIVAKDMNKAGSILGKMKQLKNKTGSYTYLVGDYKNHYVANMFYGASGIGYTLLRYYDPVEIESIFI